MRVGVTGISVVAALLSAIGIGRAQAPPAGPPPLPPAPGFVSTYEIVHTLRAAGFDPLAQPLREGTIYVARATDYRGILMRVVLDARTGAIRDANRIVAGPGNYADQYGPYGAADDAYDGAPYGPGAYGPGPYGPGPYGPGAYGSGAYGPGAYGPPGPYGPGPYGRDVYGRPSPLPDDRPPAAGVPVFPPAVRAATGAGGPPLPRPRPPELASRKPAAGAKPVESKPVEAKPAAAVEARAPVAADPGPDSKPSLTPAPTPPPASAAKATPALSPQPPAKSAKAPSSLTINN